MFSFYVAMNKHKSVKYIGFFFVFYLFLLINCAITKASWCVNAKSCTHIDYIQVLTSDSLIK